MTKAIVGDRVSRHPDIRQLADYVYTPETPFFQQLLDVITYPEVLTPSAQCGIFIFELTGTGTDGDPCDFKILACDGDPVAVRRGESLNR